jgi:hypothetical protein
MKDLRFLWPWLWRILSSVMWRCVALIRTDISEERTIIKVKRICPMTEVIHSSEAPVLTRATQCHNSEDCIILYLDIWTSKVCGYVVRTSWVICRCARVVSFCRFLDSVAFPSQLSLCCRTEQILLVVPKLHSLGVQIFLIAVSKEILWNINTKGARWKLMVLRPDEVNDFYRFTYHPSCCAGPWRLFSL